MDNKQWLMKLATIKNTTTNFTSDDIDNESISSLSLLTLIVLYGIVVFSGIIGNVTLLITLCSQSSSRLRNPLLLALCLADLLVTGVSAPLTIVVLIFKHSSHTPWSFLNVGCKAFHYMQVNRVKLNKKDSCLAQTTKHFFVWYNRFMWNEILFSLFSATKDNNK